MGAGTSSSSTVFSIIINGRRREVQGPTVYFRRIVTLAFDPLPQGANIEFTVSYRNGPTENPKGEMGQDDSLIITNGMIFNVTATDKS